VKRICFLRFRVRVSVAFQLKFLQILGCLPIGRTPKCFGSTILQLGHNISALTLEDNGHNFDTKKKLSGERKRRK